MGKLRQSGRTAAWDCAWHGLLGALRPGIPRYGYRILGGCDRVRRLWVCATELALGRPMVYRGKRLNERNDTVEGLGFERAESQAIDKLRNARQIRRVFPGI